jgi:hypothetical protein
MANQWIIIWMIIYTQLVLASTQPLLLVPVKNVVQPFFFCSSPAFDSQRVG